MHHVVLRQSQKTRRGIRPSAVRESRAFFSLLALTRAGARREKNAAPIDRQDMHGGDQPGRPQTAIRPPHQLRIQDREEPQKGPKSRLAACRSNRQAA